VPPAGESAEFRHCDHTHRPHKTATLPAPQCAIVGRTAYSQTLSAFSMVVSSPLLSESVWHYNNSAGRRAFLSQKSDDAVRLHVVAT
jgi:hypothetical protein